MAWSTYDASYFSISGNVLTRTTMGQQLSYCASDDNATSIDGSTSSTADSVMVGLTWFTDDLPMSGTPLGSTNFDERGLALGWQCRSDYVARIYVDGAFVTGESYSWSQSDTMTVEFSGGTATFKINGSTKYTTSYSFGSKQIFAFANNNFLGSITVPYTGGSPPSPSSGTRLPPPPLIARF